MRGSFEARRENGDGAVNNVVAVVAPVDHKFTALSVGANTISEIDTKFAGTSEAKLWIHATDEDYVGSESITVKLYRGDKYVGEAIVSTPAVTAGNAGSVSVSVTNMEYCNKTIITGTITVASGGAVEVFLGKLGQV